MPLGPIARLVLVAAVLSLCLACSRTDGEHAAAGKASAPSEPLRICAGTSYSILLPIAAQKGLFAREGLNVELKQYAIGRDAMEAMLAGNCDVATTADTPVADYGIVRDDLRVIAGIAKSDALNCLVAAKDSGIRRASDLKGHAIGVTKGTAPHFFLDILLNKHGLTEKDIIGTYAGIRPLIRQEGAVSESAVSREHAIFETEKGVVAMAGGKLTTYRLMAEKMADTIMHDIFEKNVACRTAELELEGQELLSGYPLAKRLKDLSDIVCECELVTRSDVEGVVQRLGKAFGTKEE